MKIRLKKEIFCGTITLIKIRFSKERKMKIKGAIFDMDGTLVNSLMFWEYLWDELNKKYINKKDFKPAEEVDKLVRAMIFSDAVAYIKDYYKLSADEKDIIDFSERGLVEFYKNVAKRKDGASELLEYLKARGIKVCLASATAREYISVALDSCGIDKYFDCILSCGDIGVGKDKPDIYLLAAEKLGLDVEEICVFEDSFVALETAKSAGFLTVGIYDKYNYEHGRLKAASTVYLDKDHTLDELIEYID